MTPFQQLYLGLGAKKKTYLDDVFSTYLYKGTNGSNTATTGLDMSGKGGLLWIKGRSGTTDHTLFDTVRGVNKKLRTDTNEAESTLSANQTFTSTGFTLNNTFSDINDHNVTYSSWNFRKASGFFDVVSYTGNGSNRTIAHSLGSVPGFYMIKRTDTSSDWLCFHREFITGNHYMILNTTGQMVSESDVAQNTRPTSSVFSVGTDSKVNADGGTYVCYLFAGGASTATTARSVNLDGSSDYLHTASSSDLTMGTGDFTVEGWIKFKSVPTSHAGFYQISPTATGLQSTNYGQTIGVGYSGSSWRLYGANGSAHSAADSIITTGEWYHIAHVRSSGVSKLYVNGVEVKSITDTYDYNGTYCCIGSYYQASFSSNAYISNFRVVKGTAVYTSSFRRPTEPLTNITNTKLLCCNNTSITGKTVGPTLTDYGNVAASTDSPFDDPAAFTFGETEDQNVVKCGSYKGTGADDGAEINLGWEPQWVLIKERDATNRPWVLSDSMRGIANGGNDPVLSPNSNGAESGPNFINLTSTGFKFVTAHGDYNGSSNYIYMAIRRPDGYVGKPAEVGTDVFTTVVGTSATTGPGFTSGFPVDFALMKQPAGSSFWNTSARLMQKKYLQTNGNDAEGDDASGTLFDYNDAYYGSGQVSDYNAWMWKRHAGFDVVTYKGNGTFGHVVKHSMNKIPEMIWLKERNTAQHWYVNHIALTGGGTYASWRGALRLNTTATAWESANVLGNFSTSSTFTLGADTDVNGNHDDYIAMLFASVDGISKVGSYTGNGSTQTITTGFQPRFVIIRRIDSSNEWAVLDTTRGWGSGNDAYIALNSNAAQNSSSYQFGEPTSNGFALVNEGTTNANTGKYIYYAHA